MKIIDIVKEWKEYKRHFVKASTFSAYGLLIQNHIIPHFGEKEAFTEAEIQKFVLTKISGGLSHKTVKDIVIVIKMLTKFGHKNGWLGPCMFDIQYPTVHSKTKMEVLTREHHKKIMMYVQNNFTFRNLGVLICLSTGMRIGEVCGLRWEDVDTDNGIISIRRTIQRIYKVSEEGKNHTEVIIDTPKTSNSIREIPMTKELQKIFKSFCKIVNPAYYVLTNEADCTEPRTYRCYYKNLMAKLEIPCIKFHGLRHSFATRCIEGKADYKTVSVLLGHSNINTTLNLYVHPTSDQKKKVIQDIFKNL